MVEVKLNGDLARVALREGGAGSHKEWAFLVRGSKVTSFRNCHKGERCGGYQTYWADVRPGDLIVTVYRSGSGKTFVLEMHQVESGRLNLVFQTSDSFLARRELERRYGKGVATYIMDEGW